MMIDDELINEILKIAYKAVPKKCVLDGNKLIEVHNELGEFLKIKLLNKAHVIQSFCVCPHGFKKKNYDSCAICGGKWKGRPKQNVA